jgi:hypothetical protein
VLSLLSNYQLSIKNHFFTNYIRIPIACIPAYNEEETIAKVIIKTQKYIDKVIVCDGGKAKISSEIAIYAYHSLCIEVFLQFLCFLKYSEKENEDNK